MAISVVRKNEQEHSWERQHYGNVLVLNVVLVAADTAMAVVMGLWLVDSVVYHDNTLDHLGMTVLPVFCPVSLGLPLCVVWLWIAFARTTGGSWLRVLAPAIITVLVAVYAVAAGYITWVVLVSGVVASV